MTQYPETPPCWAAHTILGKVRECLPRNSMVWPLKWILVSGTFKTCHLFLSISQLHLVAFVKFPLGVLKKVLYGEARPRGPTRLPFIYHFWQKRPPLLYTLYWQLVPLLHTKLRKLHPFNLCKCTAFKIWKQHKTRKFSRLFLSFKFFC